MNRRMRTYYYAIFGAIGGLFSVKVSDVLGLSFVSNLFLSEAIVGALIGLCIGFFIGITEGALTRNIVRAGKSGLIGGVFGLVAGAIGLPLSEYIFQGVGASWIGRMLGWGIFGLLIGLAEGMVGKNQAWKGMAGGFVGGVIGGFLLESSHAWLKDPLYGKILGLMLLGASTGAFISLIVVLLSRAWFEVISGKLKGTEFILDKFMKQGGQAIAIGSSALKSEIVFPDPDIAPQHALLTSDGIKFSIKDMSMNGMFINNKRLERTQLSDGQHIRMGNTEFVYHEKRSS